MLLEACEEAVKQKETEITFKGITMNVSKAQNMGIKCLKHKLITNTVKSLKKRFLSDEIEILKSIDKILSTKTNPHQPLEQEIEFLSSKYPISLVKKDLHGELKVLRGLKKSYSSIKTIKTFAGIIAGNYMELVPQCAFLAQLYLLAPVQNAVVERAFSFQNIILTSRRNRLLLETVSKLSLIHI